MRDLFFLQAKRTVQFPVGQNFKLTYLMKKTLYFLSLVLFSMVFSLNMTSCNSSDDDDTTEVVNNKKIVGKWFYEDSNFYSEQDYITEDAVEMFVSWICFTELGDVSWFDTDLQEIIYGDYRLDGTTLYIYNIEHEDYLPYNYTVKSLTDEDLTLHVKMEGLYSMDVHYKKRAN